jgi:hypothetical protein
VLDGSGHPVVSYFDSSKCNLKIMHCNDPNCDGDDESTTSPDTAGFAGQYTSRVLDCSGHPVVSYTSDRNTNLRIMHCNDSNCAGGDESITSPDTTSRFGNYTSLQLDSSGYPVISYWDTANGDLRVMHCNDPNCTGGDESMTAPDTAGIVGDYTSLVLDSDGYPLISYYDLSNGDLKLLHCGDANCMISNTAPTVEAGRPYEGLPNNAIALSDASASDSDGDGLSYSWTVDSGACTFSDATALNPNLTCTASGNVTVTLTVDDGTDTASDSATVTVITPQQAISNLQSDIQSLVDNGTLKPGQANGLSKPLDNAIRSLDKGNTADACDQLQDFIDEVNAKTPDPLDAGTAAGLLDAAEAIRVAVGCS